MSDVQRPYFEIANPEVCNILRTLPSNLDVLDVGCGSGVHGALLKRVYGHRVVGVDCSEVSIKKAQSRLAEAYSGDVTKPNEYPFASSGRFDVILFSDILEHLHNPEEVLGSHLFLLRRKGHILVSVPNVAIWNVRASLLLGSFQYQDTGTLDRTHIRFFTRKTAKALVESPGVQIESTAITPGILRPLVPLIKRVYGIAGRFDGQSDSSSIMASRPYQMYSRWVYPVENAICRLWPGLLAFQFVILGQAGLVGKGTGKS